MKKIMTSLASIVLASGSVANATAWQQQNSSTNSLNKTTTNEDATMIGEKLEGKTILLDGTYWIGKDIFNYHQQLADQIVKLGLLTKDEVQYVSWGHLLITASKYYHSCDFTVKKDGKIFIAHNITLDVAETAQEITNKLNGKTVTLDPNFWVGKNLANYEQDMNNVLVKEHLLTSYEVQYVHWNSFNINNAGWYWNNVGFYASKGGPQYGAYGKVTINASTGETTQQIAKKLEKAKINFNFNYWNGKSLQNYLPEIRSILVNENILTKAESSVVAGIAHPVTINHASVTSVVFDINDNNTNTDATVNVNVLNDGGDAKQVINSIGNEINLKSNTVGQYADNIAIEQYALTYINDVWSGSGIQNVTLAHQLISKGNNNIPLTIFKDGQTATRSFTLYSETNPTTKKQSSSDFKDIRLIVNLNSVATQALKKFFQNSSASQNTSLEYFLNMLNNGKWNSTGKVPDCNNFGFDDSQTLGNFINGFGNPFENVLFKIQQIASESYSFYNGLRQYLASNISCATMMIDIHYKYFWHIYQDDYYVNQYNFV